MPGKYQYDIELKSNVAKLLTDMKEVQDRLDTVEGKEYKIKLNVDEKKLSNVISNLEKMLDSLGKGTGDFKQFENLSKELSSIVSEVQNLSKAFGKVDDSGTKTLLSSIQNIDKSLSELSQHIINVNKNMSNIGGDTNSTVKQVENISNAYDNASKSAEKLVEAQSKIGNKSNISSENSIVESQNKIQEELKETQEQATKTNNEIITLYRGVSKGSGVKSDLGDSFFTTDLESAIAYAGGLEGEVYKLELPLSKIKDFLQFNANGGNFALLDNLGNGTDEVSKKLINLVEKLKELEKEGNVRIVKKDFFGNVFDTYTEEAQKIIDEIKSINRDTSSLLGASPLKDSSSDQQWGLRTDDLARKAKANGYNGVVFDNIQDSALIDGRIIKSISILNDELLKTAQLISQVDLEKVFNSSDILKTQFGSIEGLQENLSEVRQEVEKTEQAIKSVAETPIKDVFQGGIEEKSIDTLKAKIKEIFTDTDELKRVLKSLDEGSYFHLDWYKDSELKDFTDVDERIGKLIPLLKEYGYTIKNLNSSSDSLETSGSIVSLADENDKLEKITTSAKDAATSKEKFANANKEVKASAEETVISVDKEISALEKAGSRFESQAAGLAIKPDDQHQFSSWKKQLEDLNIEIAEYKSKVENLSKIDIADEAQINKAKTEIEELGKSIKDTITSMKNIPQASRGWNQSQVDKLIQRMNDDLKKNSKYTDETKQKIQGLIDELNNIPDRPLSEVFNDFSRFKREAHDAGKEGKAFFEIFKDKVIYGGAAQLAGMFGFYDIINIFRDGINTLKEFDDGLTKISYTMDMTKSQLDGLGKSVLDTANDIDSSIDNAMQVSQIYANMNTSAEEIKKLSEPTLILSNLTGFDASTVADDIQAVTQQFDIAAESSMHIADVYDQISRNISVDYSKGIESIAEAVQVAGSTADQAGLSFEQLAAIVGKTVEKTRLEGSQVGNGLKTIMTRLSKVGKLSEEVDNETLSQASESLKKVGIEVYNLDGSYREFDVIMGELASKWDGLTDAEKSNISFNIAATRQTNLLSAVLSNFSDSMQLAEEATNANGNALENNQKWVDSFGGHLQSLENTAKSAWINILDSETIKGGVDLLNILLERLTKFIDTVGVLPTLAGIGGVVAGFKNVGINTLVAY